MAKERPPRKHLGTDALYRQIYQIFQDVPDCRRKDSLALADALMSGFAVFALKDPSLLAFDQRRRQDAKNLEMIFHIAHVPCDTQMRETLDPVDPEEVRPAFCNIFAELAHGKVLEEMVFLDDYYLLALDGTEYFSSRQVHCDHCLHKKLSNGEVVYHHALLGAAIVCPGRREAIPLMPEPILNGDGQDKNDCERNALRRWLRIVIDVPLNERPIKTTQLVIPACSRKHEVKVNSVLPLCRIDSKCLLPEFLHASITSAHRARRAASPPALNSTPSGIVLHAGVDCHQSSENVVF